MSVPRFSMSRRHAELLAQFPSQGVGVRLSSVDLSARKFPQAGKVDAMLASRDEESPVLFDDGGDDDDHARDKVEKDAQRRLIGHSAQRGARAEHTVAPKSISA